MVMEIFYTFFSPFITLVKQAESKQKIQMVIFFSLCWPKRIKNTLIWGGRGVNYFRRAFFFLLN